MSETQQGKTQLHGDGGEAGDALRRIQSYDSQSLVRESDLGSKYALREIVKPVERVLTLFKMISPSQVSYFPERQQNIIKDEANAFYNLLEQCAKFDVENADPTPTEAKNNLITQVENRYQPIFDQLFPLISFATARSQDFAQLERDARAASQAARDQANSLIADLNQQKESAEVILGEVRATAAEQGVGKQAIHFKNEADFHKDQAKTWFRSAIWVAILLVLYSIFSLFFHYIPGLEPTDNYKALQLAVSKVLIFAVIAYILFLSARNFMSHRHNEVVNRHRQNALATFTALAEATSDAASSDIVLSHAASCIFSPQDTGWTKGDASYPDGVPSLQLIPRIGHIGGAS